MQRLLISAAHKSSGKTTVTVGLCAALSARGLIVQPFKKGPDYIDPMWLAQASGRPCFNLDPYLSSESEICDQFHCHSAQADISLVEGNKGLYDGLALDGSNSNAALAHMLDLPVVLVIDARGMTRGIAPLILGYQAFDKRIRISGVILNQLGGARHESKLRAVIEHYTDVPVIGAIGHDPCLAVVERHLGLMPNHEMDDAALRVRSMGDLISSQVDLDRLRQAALVSTSPLPKISGAPSTINLRAVTDELSVRIGVVQDKAFGFYYPDDLLAIKDACAEIVPINTLRDAVLPNLDGLFIGGGFPEMFMAELEANKSMRASICDAIQSGLPTYAECGGLMYLARTLRWKERSFEMVGALPVDVVMHERPVGRGYVELEPTQNAPWNAGPDAAASVRGHEFHYSSLENVPSDLVYAYKVKRGHGIDGANDGICYRNAVASYAHLRSSAGSEWASQFVAFVKKMKTSLASEASTRTRQIIINGKLVQTDAEGYLINTHEWSEDFATASAKVENLELTAAHWQVILFLRTYFEEHQVQAQVRAMIRHFSTVWGPELGNNHHLHTLFPMGGPQKQGNRLAGLLKTKGEH